MVRAVSDSAKIFMYDYFYAGIPTPPSFAFGRRSGSIDREVTTTQYTNFLAFETGPPGLAKLIPEVVGMRTGKK